MTTMWTLPLHLLLWTYAFAQNHWWESPGGEESRVVYPFRTDKAGHVISPDVSSSSTSLDPAEESHYDQSFARVPRSAGNRTKKGSTRHQEDAQSTQDDKLYIVINNANEELFLSLTPNTRLVTPYTVIEWVLEDGRRIYKRPAQGCFYTGRLQSQEGSLVAVSNCGGLTGYIQTANTSYFIQPLKRPDGDSSSDETGPQPHLIYTVQAVTSHLNLSLQQDQEFQTLTETDPPFQIRMETKSQPDPFQTPIETDPQPDLFHTRRQDPGLRSERREFQTHTDQDIQPNQNHHFQPLRHPEFQGDQLEHRPSDVTQFQDTRTDPLQRDSRLLEDLRRQQQHQEFQHQIPGGEREEEDDEGETVLEDDQLFKRRRKRRRALGGVQLAIEGEEEEEEEEEKEDGDDEEEELLSYLELKRTNWRRMKRSQVHPKFRRWRGTPKFARNSGTSKSTERRGRSANRGVAPKFNAERTKREEEEEEEEEVMHIGRLEEEEEEKEEDGLEVSRRRDLDAGSGMAEDSDHVGRSGSRDNVDDQIHPHQNRMDDSGGGRERRKRKGKKNGCKKKNKGGGKEGEGNTDLVEEEGNENKKCKEGSTRRLSREERARRREERRTRRRLEREQRKRERERRQQEKKRRRKEERKKRRQECMEVKEGGEGNGDNATTREGGNCTPPEDTEGEEERKRKERRSKRREERRRKQKKKKKRKGRKNRRRTNEVQSEETISSETPQVSSRVADPWEGQDWDGYSPDLWSGQVAPGSSGLQEVTAVPPLARPDPPKWVELVVAADHTLIQFHGQDQVEKYVFTLFNIVSAIYQDPSLEAKLELVMLRVIFYNDTKHSQVREGQAKKSLEAVNRWAERLYRVSPHHLRHDLAVWLTRIDLGGPSGYAPVSGVCQPARSCTLNRDEGLTSAFIIAHEMAHVLGLSHDGDSVAGNHCEDEGFQGSVMAPLVAATFNRFHWSTCSRQEYHAKAGNWECLLNQPQWKNATTVQSTIQYQYSLDDQCRMEFGDGYGLCDSFGGGDPCVHLWCSNASAPFHCKTKKGPPLEGTICGEHKWCHQGFCVPVSGGGEDRGGRGDPPVRHNPRPGGWGPWSSWGPCSRTCGTGVSFRIRSCDNPTPAWGGRRCRGKREDWRVCSHDECGLPRRDLRALQCSQLRSIVPLDPRRAALTWLPYEPKKRKKKCRISCYSHPTNEVYIGREFVVDGTPCSYDTPSNICVQGKCVGLGCNGVMGSSAQEDQCGVCEGDGSTCVTHHYQYQQVPPQEYSLVATLPAGAHNIMVREEAATGNFLALSSNSSSRSSASFSLNGGRHQEPSQSFISEGAKFVYSNRDERELLRARGPLLSPLSVLIHGMAVGESVQVTTTYLTQLQPEHHQWEVGPYTACSVTCGGGEQHQTLVCRDRRTDRQVFHDRCHHLPRPALNTTSCNTFGCEARWVTGLWEHCSATCGPGGVQERGMFCVTLPEATAANWSIGIVDPRSCNLHSMPETQQPCLRDPCPGHWMPRGWAQCSSSCGEGVQERTWECVGGGEDNEVTYACGPEPKQVRVCFGPSCPPAPCLRDVSSFCQLSVLHRYCQLPKYRELCCHTCANVVY